MATGIETRTLGSLFPGMENTRIEISDFGFPFLNLDHAVNCPTSLVVLLLLVKHQKCKRVFEIGTNLGQSTAALAVNTSSDAQIYTLDLGDERFWNANPSLQPLRESNAVTDVVGTSFRQSPHLQKIKQLWVDQNDLKPLYGTMDCVYVDADHAGPGLAEDTELAFKLVAPGGWIVWDDYGKVSALTSYIDELAKRFPLKHVRATEIVLYAAPQLTAPSI
jgi:predicted O-methyltransferase YrrM